MPKAILEFNLPEDDIEFQCANNAGEVLSALWDFREFLRQRYKHAPPSSQGGE